MSLIDEIVSALEAESKRYHAESWKAHEAGDKKQRTASIHYSEAINWCVTKIKLMASAQDG